MGMAFAKSFLKIEQINSSDFLLIEKLEARIQDLKESFQPGAIATQITDEMSGYDVVIMAVKPQDFSAIAAELANVITPAQTVVSIMAGIPIARIQAEVKHQKVVRAMPNTPAILGMGITGYTASPEVTADELAAIDTLISATGKAVFIQDEAMIDGVTAISGSGPAYFFYIVKGMIASAVKLGFEEEVAAQLVKQTMLGAYHLMETQDKTLDELIQAVTSKGGTTEAALKSFATSDLHGVIDTGIVAARDRSIELSK